MIFSYNLRLQMFPSASNPDQELAKQILKKESKKFLQNYITCQSQTCQTLQIISVSPKMLYSSNYELVGVATLTSSNFCR